jgi:hypothetical protein
MTSSTAAPAARFGLVAKGSLYALLALLVLQVALGDRARRPDTQGALRTVAAQPYGRAVLAVLAIGFAVYAAWQVYSAWTGDELRPRLAAAGRALLWTGLAGSAARFVLGNGSSSSSDESITATVMSAPLGPWLVGAAGAAIIVVGVSLLREIRGGRYLQDLRPLPAAKRRVVSLAATTGIIAKTSVWALAGAFLIRAAVRHDPSSGVGLDGALAQVAQERYGFAVLTTCAFGMAAYAVWCALRARYEDVERSNG